VNLPDLSLDAKALMLLYVRLSSGGEMPSLTGEEYHRLSGWLLERELKPADLFDADTLDIYSDLPVAGIQPDRVRWLMNRGAALTMELEKWLSSGFWILSREDADYPARAKEVLGRKAPLLMFGSGNPALLMDESVAIIGSRNLDESGQEFAFNLGAACAGAHLTVISGGARGADSYGMRGALENGGRVVGVLAGDLAKSASSPETRQMIEARRLTLIALHRPDVPFTVGGAMERNKVIYALARATVIVSAEPDKGGTWAGAEENSRNWRVPAFIRQTPELPGNQLILARGWGTAFPAAALEDPRLLLDAGQDEATGGRQEELL